MDSDTSPGRSCPTDTRGMGALTDKVSSSVPGAERDRPFDPRKSALSNWNGGAQGPTVRSVRSIRRRP